MLISPKYGDTVFFNPPENAYSPNCYQQRFAKQFGTLKGLSETSCKIEFIIKNESFLVSVNSCYVYDLKEVLNAAH